MIMQAPDSTIFPYTTLFRSGGETGKGEGSGCPGVLRHPVVRLSTRSARFLSLLRQPATARDRPGPGHRTQAPAVGRTDRGDEPQGDGGDDSPDLAPPPRAGADRGGDRARHARGEGCV